MPALTTADAHEDSVVALPAEAARTVESLAATLLPVAGGRMDEPDWLREAARRWHELPLPLRTSLTAFRRDSGPAGTLLIRGLPVDEELLPDTPSAKGSVQREATIPAGALMLVTSALGDPIAFRPEKSGAMVHDVVPVPGSEAFQGNEGSVLLSLHTENAFHADRPDYVLLLCLRADHEQVAALRTVSVRQVGRAIPDPLREALASAEYVTDAPPSFGSASGAGRSVPHAVLGGAPDDPDLLVDFAATQPQTPRAAAALRDLRDLLAEHAVNHYLRPGDLAVVDNAVTVHGRSGFTPRYDGRDRWLQRSFATRDLRRSRPLRPGDGHVLIG